MTAQPRQTDDREAFERGYRKALKDVLWHLRFPDSFDSPTAQDIEAKFADHPAVKGKG